MTFSDQQLKNIKRILVNNRRWVKAHALKMTYGEANDVAGWCVESSHRVWLQLSELCPKVCIADVTLELAKWKGSNYNAHCFNIVNDMILDVTADQFDFRDGTIPPAIVMKRVGDLTFGQKDWWWG